MLVFLQIIFCSLISVQAMPTAHSVGEILQTDEPHVFFGDLGFKISTKGTSWDSFPIQDKSSTVQAQFFDPNPKTQAKLTVRSEDLKKQVSLKRYVQLSKRDFNRFGFRILARRPLKVNDQYAYVIDLKQNNSTKQLRQVLFKRKNTIVILTCSAHEDHFKQELKTCNKIYRNFTWL